MLLNGYKMHIKRIYVSEVNEKKNVEENLFTYEYNLFGMNSEILIEKQKYNHVYPCQKW